MSAVRTPTGRLELLQTLAMESAVIRSRPPITAEQGIRSLDFEPTIILAKCGIMSPTKPIVPEKQTATAVQTEATTIHTILRMNGLTPSEMELLSPEDNTSILLAITMENPNRTAIDTAM